MDKRIIDKIRHDGSKPSDLVLHLLPAVLVQDVIVHQGHNKLVPAAVYVLQPGGIGFPAASNTSSLSP